MVAVVWHTTHVHATWLPTSFSVVQLQSAVLWAVATGGRAHVSDHTVVVWHCARLSTTFLDVRSDGACMCMLDVCMCPLLYLWHACASVCVCVCGGTSVLLARMRGGR